MPDLINPEYTDNGRTYIVWRDELCASCLNQDSCSLLQVMHHCIILTYSGLHVANCKDYNPNKGSEYYLEPATDADTDEGFEAAARMNLAALQQKMDLMKKKLGMLDGLPKR